MSEDNTNTILPHCLPSVRIQDGIVVTIDLATSSVLEYNQTSDVVRHIAQLNDASLMID